MNYKDLSHRVDKILNEYSDDDMDEWLRLDENMIKYEKNLTKL